jgi:hypothetical protein
MRGESEQVSIWKCTRSRGAVNEDAAPLDLVREVAGLGVLDFIVAVGASAPVSASRQPRAIVGLMGVTPPRSMNDHDAHW